MNLLSFKICLETKDKSKNMEKYIYPKVSTNKYLFKISFEELENTTWSLNKCKLGELNFI